MQRPSSPAISHRVDLPKNQRSGLEKAVRILRNIDGIAHIELDEDDVVRHRLVKAIIKAYDRTERKPATGVHPRQLEGKPQQQ